jgi:hypothetical protein
LTTPHLVAFKKRGQPWATRSHLNYDWRLFRHRILEMPQELRREKWFSRVEKIGDFDNFVGMSRLTIEIETEQHRQIKTLRFPFSVLLPPS